MYIKKIDENAINKLKTLITKSEYLAAENVEYRGTTPCYDGDIVLFNNANQTKNGGTSTARIQVKGKVVTKFREKLVYNKLQLNDLETYKNDNGVIFFVVAMRNVVNDIEKDVVVYCKTLFGNELVEILEHKQKTFSISLRKVNNGNELLEIVRYFVVNRNPMTYPLIRLENNYEKKIDKFIVNNIHIGKYSAKFTEFTTLNVEIDDVVRTVDFTFDHMKLSKDIILKIDGREYNSNINYKISKIDIENQTTIASGIMIKIRRNSINLNFKLKQEYDFYNSFLISKVFQTLRNKKQVEINGEPLTLLEINKINEDLDFVNVVNTIIDIYQELELLGISMNEMKLKTILTELNVVKSFLKLFHSNNSNFNRLSVSGSNLYFTKVFDKIFLVKKEVDGDLNQFFSLPFINEDHDLSLNLIKNEVQINLPMIMSIKDWTSNDNRFDPINLSNFYFDKGIIVKNLIEKIDHDNLIFYNDFALCLINGYDKNNDKLSLEIAGIIFSNIVNMSPTTLFFINHQQTLLRLNSSIDNSAISKIENETNDDIIKFACFIILGEFNLSLMLYQRLNEIELKTLKDTPIMNLFYSMYAIKKDVT